MVRSGTYKLMLNADGADPTADALYDLQADPEEMTNLIGRSRSDADRQSPLVVANGMVVKAATFFKQSPSSTAQALGTQLQSRVIK
jgi:arylsulfatase A-like enzyme